jgi:hypothetical protein
MKALIAIAAVLLAATACGATPEAQQPPKIASLATTDQASPAPSPQSQPAKERARYRLDMTDQEKEDLNRPYLQCMKDHGVDVLLRREGQAGAKPDQSTLDRAAKACDLLLPLPAWEEDATNPEAMDFAKKVVDCLRAKGVKKVEVSSNNGMVGPSFGGEENDQDSITKGLNLTPQCEKEVSAQK